MKECDSALSSMIDALCLYNQTTRDSEMEKVTRNQEETREQEDIQEKKTETNSSQRKLSPIGCVASILKRPRHIQ